MMGATSAVMVMRVIFILNEIAILVVLIGVVV
jgi:hypothetical protein